MLEKYIALVTAIIGFFTVLIALILHFKKHLIKVNFGSRKFDIKKLNSKRQIKLFKQWESIPARCEDILNQPAISIEKQKEYQILRKINFATLNELLDFLHLGQFHLSLPLSNEENQLIRGARTNVIEKVSEKFNYFINNPSDCDYKKLTNLLSEIYDYLSEDDNVSEKCDFLFVPGAKTHLRAKKAGELFLEGKGTYIFLSGLKPYYEKKDFNVVTEAEAMYCYLMSVDSDLQGKINPERITIEKRSQDTRENAYLSAKVIGKFREKIGRPINIAIVTSPYHLYR
ncbi:MAG: YdcF family protein, partial [Planctomycetota bacterium]